MEGIPEKDMEERRRMLEQKNQGINTTIISGSIHKLHVWLCSSWFSETQKKKQNQDDSDEYDDDDEPGPSFQQPAARQPQAGYVPPMTQPGMLPVGSGTPALPPGSYSGGEQILNLICNVQDCCNTVMESYFLFHVLVWDARKEPQRNLCVAFDRDVFYYFSYNSVHKCYFSCCATR